MQKKYVFFCLIPLFFLSSCIEYKDVEFKGVESVKILSANKEKIQLSINARIYNPNNYNIKVVDADLDVSIKNKIMGKGILKNNVVLTKQKETVNDFIVNIKPNSLFNLAGVIVESFFKGGIPVSIKGSINVKIFFIIKKKIPVDIKTNTKSKNT